MLLKGVFSAAQRSALDPGFSVWLSANAGTGKTQVLTGRVLRLMLEGAKPEKILCLTYTNAAAAEMADRIRREVANWAAIDDVALADGLAALLERVPVAADIRRARELFHLVVDRPEALHIQTIHGFCQSLLRRFPLEAGISPSAQVMEEEAGATLAAEIFPALVKQEALGAAFDILALEQSDDGIRDLLNEVYKMQRQLKPGLFTKGAVRMAAELALKLGVDPAHKPEDVRRAACDDAAFDKEVLGRLASMLQESDNAAEQARGAVMAAWLYAGPEKRMERWEEYSLCFLTQKYKILQKIPLVGTQKRYPESVAITQAEQRRVLQVYEQLWALQTWRRTAALLTVAEAFFHAFEQRKAERALLDYDDLIVKTQALLEDAELAAWVKFRLDGGITHLLLDEAQDTSPEQWAIIQAICEEFFAGNGAVETARTLFVVGDPKQSIYGFQGADPALFGTQNFHFQQRAEAARQNFRPEQLSLSYRSTESVLRVVDGVLTHADVIARLRGMVIASHDLHRKDAAGRVELWPLARCDKPEKSEGWIYPQERERKADPQRDLVASVADTIAGWLHGGRMLESKGRKLEPGDILILLRERGVLMDRLVRALKKRGVPIAGVDRLMLKEHILVQDLLALGRFLLLPQDDMSLAIVLKSPFIGLDEEALYALAHDRGAESLWSRLKESPYAEAYERLSEMLRRTDFLPPYELYAFILDAAAGRRRAVARMGEEVQDICNSFLTQALVYEKEQVPSLEGFLLWMEARAAKIKRTPELSGNQVRIMTVHGAKGLQAPVVILPDSARSHNTKPQRTPLYWDAQEQLAVWCTGDLPPYAESLKEAQKAKALAEEARLLYVALTRAADELYLTGWVPMSSGDEWWYQTLQDVMKKEDAMEVAAPKGLEGKALVLSNPQRVPVMPDKNAPANIDRSSLPPSLKLPAQKEEVTKPVPITSLTPSSAYSGTASEGARERGVAIHRLLELLPGQEAKIDSPLMEEVQKLMQHPEFREFFDPATSLAEASVMGLVQGVRVAGRIDRLVVRENEVILIDFKTAREMPATIPPEYHAQMAAYASLLAAVYPGKTIRSALIYTAGPWIAWLS